MSWEIAATIAIEAVGLGMQIAFPTIPQSIGIAIMVAGIVPLAWLGLKRINAGNITRNISDRLKDALPAIHFGSRIDRMPIIELRDLASEKYRWDFQSLHFMDFIHGLAQAGTDGALKFWGRLDRNIFEDLMHDERLREIPKDHWLDFQFLGTEFWQAEKNIEMQSRAHNKSDDEGFVDIHVERGPAIRWLKRDADSYKGRTK